MMRSDSWRAWVSILKFLQVFVFSNIFVCEGRDRPLIISAALLNEAHKILLLWGSNFMEPSIRFSLQERESFAISKGRRLLQSSIFKAPPSK
ncbi:unnamed protein product [Toxocara canis]|uniref:Secreted protein n=1 Tax=Toxocara canis TaxID=6265 RepID=A0A183UTV4_TOXCA|nr:unnamed protein product [Toxocara canis]